MVPTDIDLVDLSAALEQGVTSSFDKSIQVSASAPCIGIAHRDGFDYIIARGSVAGQDYLRDADSEIGVRIEGYPELGLLPKGFSEGLVDTAYAIWQAVKSNVLAFGGHSLGAPESLYQAYVARLDGYQVARVGQFAPPRQGTTALLATNLGCPITAYINQGDPVPNVPVPIPLLLPWVTIGALRSFSVPAPSTDTTPWRQHSVLLYQQGVRELS